MVTMYGNLFLVKTLTIPHLFATLAETRLFCYIRVDFEKCDLCDPTLAHFIFVLNNDYEPISIIK